MERTLVLIKPDGVKKGLTGEIIKRFEQRGLKIIGMKMLIPSLKILENHYTDDLEWLESVGNKTISSYKKRGKKMDKSAVEIGKWVRSKLMEYLRGGVPVTAMVFEGFHAVDVVRKIVGDTEPRTAQVGTIRGDFSFDSYHRGDAEGRPINNVVHASGNVKEAKHEVSLWFSESELFTY